MKRHVKFSMRRAAASPILFVLLSGILLALGILIAILLRPVPPPIPGSSGNGSRQPPAKTKPIGDPERIKEVLQTGKSYRSVLKFGLDARVEDKDWGVKQVTNIAYCAEMQVTRRIESNDGHRIVELRTFDRCRNSKLLFDVEGVSIELGSPGILILGALDYLQPGAAEAAVVAKPLAEGLLKGAAQRVVDSQATKAVAFVDSLSGKTVRLMYVDKSASVESVVPVGCELDATERAFVSETAVLADCYILPDVKSKPGASWTVDGSQFGGLFDPTMRGSPTGEIAIKRADDEIDGDKQIAKLQIERGRIELQRVDSTARRIGTFVPRGWLRYNVTDGFVQSAEMTGDMKIESVSQNHILFAASFRTEPRLQIQYSCQFAPQ